MDIDGISIDNQIGAATVMKNDGAVSKWAKEDCLTLLMNYKNAGGERVESQLRNNPNPP